MKVFVSYAHDGDTYASWLVDQLKAAGCDVHWDGGLPEFNPSSIQEWMEEQVRNSAVVCIVTPPYAERFGSGSDSPQHKGVLYESRAIEQRLHDHTPAGACPVIPVVPTAEALDSLPIPLRRLLVTQVSRDDSSGMSELLTRLRALSHTLGNMEKTGSPQPDRVRAPQNLQVTESAIRDSLSRLEAAQSGNPSAISLVNEWLSIFEANPASTPSIFAHGFADAERIAKTAGDLQLMMRISNACLAAVRSSGPSLRSDLETEARVLVCGEGWYLQRSHKLQAALDSTRLGVQFAIRARDRRTEAFGKKCLGRLERLVAEDTRDLTLAQAHLRQSVVLLQDAREMFFGLDGRNSDEAGDCLSLQGRTLLTHYRLIGATELLAEAKVCIEQAGELIPPHNSKDYWDLMILTAESKLEERHITGATRLLQEVIDRLRGSSDGPRCEILARALYTHALAQQKWHPHANAGRALRDLEDAEAIYRELGQDNSASECLWGQIVIDPARVTSLQLGRDELEELAKLERDPRVRLEAVRKLDAQEKLRVGTSIGRRVKQVAWETILHRLRQDDHQRSF